MANSDENTTPEAPAENSAETTAEAPAQKKTAKRAAKKSAKKSAKKTAKKAAKKTAKKTAKNAAKKSAKKTAKRSAKKSAESVTEPPAQPATEPLMDRSQLRDKTRVFTLAKTLGMSSKDLVTALGEIGLTKVAQSSLSREEAEQLLDALETRPDRTTPDPATEKPVTEKPDADEPATEKPAAEPEQSEEKIRHRVRKNVENEIHQIEEKVEKDLKLVLAEEAGEADSIDADDLLTNIEPDITPAPEDDEDDASTGIYAPIFKAAPRTTRRRASRSSGGGETTAPRQAADETEKGADEVDEQTADDTRTSSGRRRSRRSVSSSQQPKQERKPRQDSPEDDDAELIEEPKAIKGSSRLEAQRRRRSERREEERKRSRVVSQAEFLARRESVERTMVVRERQRHDGPGKLTQVGVLEDGMLVEHFVDSDESASMIGNIYLGRVQNVLSSMEAAFIDIGQGRNGVLYAGEVDWKAAGLGGRARRIEQALKSGDQVLVQVTKDPVGHKGARLTTQISLAGRYLVYVPGGRSAGISRKLPAPERKRLKDILVKVVPGKGGAIIRTAAEGASEEAIAADVARLHNQWETIQEQAEKEKKSKGAKPVTLYEEPQLLVKVVRDLFNEDFDQLIVDGKKPWNVVSNYVESVAPDLSDRLVRFDRREHDGHDAFDVYRVDEQIQKALSRTVWLPSGGTLVIDRTEAMTVIDVNTGKFTGSGGSLEETVTSNNLEAAEEIVRQLRLRDIGGMIIIDFIDMILPENQELVLRRFKEALGRDRTRHQVSEVTSLGLVQLTRKRLGTGLVETFSTPCEHCGGRGILLSDDPVDPSQHSHHPGSDADSDKEPEKGDGARSGRRQSRRRKPAQDPAGHPAALAMQNRDKSSVEELVDAVVVADDTSDIEEIEDIDDRDNSDGDNSDGDKPRRRSSRRRGRRGSGRGRGRNQQDQHDQPDQQEQHDSEPEESAQAPAKTYEEAVEEFENSPRRKRKTRGNSKSDHRPRPEDFEAPEESESVEDTEQPQEKPADQADEHDRKQTQQTASRSRGRRRATRRTTGHKQQSLADNREERPETPAKPPQKKKSGGSQQDKSSRGSSGGARASRGRRRATRKTTE